MTLFTLKVHRFILVVSSTETVVGGIHVNVLLHVLLLIDGYMRKRSKHSLRHQRSSVYYCNDLHPCRTEAAVVTSTNLWDG